MGMEEMGFQQFHHRKLIYYSINETAADICESACNLADNSTFCRAPCLYFCPNYCKDFLKSLVPPQSPPVFTYDYHPNKSRKFLIITVSVISIILFALLCYVIFVKFYLGWWSGSRRRSSQPQVENDQFLDDFLEENHGPVVDHHIWYINTEGLQPSIISAITVCKYKKGDGLVEGTVCSVCLSEFQDDETLRLLPKCSHAFHVPCIDTWLRSHTNCPMCRAPIVKNATTASSSEPTVEDSGTNENTQLSVLVDNGETNRELEDEAVTEEEGEVQLEHTSRRSEDSEEIQPIRRSVSLDCVSASKMIQGVANFVPEEITGNNLDTQLAENRDFSMKFVPKRVGRTESLRKFVGNSSIGRSLQNAPFSLKRSFSCSGKFLFPRST